MGPCGANLGLPPRARFENVSNQTARFRGSLSLSQVQLPESHLLRQVCRCRPHPQAPPFGPPSSISHPRGVTLHGSPSGTSELHPRPLRLQKRRQAGEGPYIEAGCGQGRVGREGQASHWAFPWPHGPESTEAWTHAGVTWPVLKVVPGTALRTVRPGGLCAPCGETAEKDTPLSRQ